MKKLLNQYHKLNRGQRKCIQSKNGNMKTNISMTKYLVCKAICVFLYFSIYGSVTFCFPSENKIVFSFPDGFLWGVANSAQQVEGGLENNSWEQWEKKGRVPKVGKATDFYNRYKEDIALAKSLNLNAFRFSIEWSRVEPEPGKFDEKEIEHYRKLIKEIRANKMEPVVTCLHYVLPTWVLSLEPGVQSYGGWDNEKTADAFASYCGRMAKEFGDMVDLWLTMNEPVVDLFAGYAVAVFPPGKLGIGDIRKTTNAPMRNMISGHAKAYHAIHENDKKDANGDGIPARVSIAHSIMALFPHPPDSKEAQDATDRFSHFWNWMFVDVITSGVLDEDGDNKPETQNPLWKNTLDFLGINFYNYEAVVPVKFFKPVSAIPCIGQFMNLFPKANELFGCPAESKSVSESHEGFYKVIMDSWERYKLPILVTENGTVDEEGTRRAWYIVRNLVSLHQAITMGAEVFGYLYWSLTDNYEWGLGYKMPFGLVKVDFSDPSLPRTMRKGSDVYGKIARMNGMTADLLAEYMGNP